MKQVGSVLRAFRILDSFQAGKRYSISEVSRELSLPKSSVYELLTTLANERVVERDSASSGFQLGIKLIELGNRARYNFPLNRLAAPHLEALREAFNETVYLTVLDQGQVFYADCYESTRALKTFSTIGDRAPLYCTAVGKAILAFQSPQEIRRILETTRFERFTRHTIADPAALLEELHEIAEQGYSVDDMEHEAGVRCVGAPIRGAEGRTFAAVSVSGPAQRVTRARQPEIAARVVATAREISSSLGWRPAGPRAGAADERR